MRIKLLGCDLHAPQQTLAMLGTTTGDVVNRTLCSFLGQEHALVTSTSPSLPGILGGLKQYFWKV